MKNTKLCLLLIFLFFVTILQASSPQLTAYYSFDTLDTLNKDNSGNGNHLIPYDNSPASFAPNGKKGGCARFNGSTQGYQAPIKMENSGSFSISVWVKFDEIKPSENPQVIAMPLQKSTGFRITTAWEPSKYAFGTYSTNGSEIIKSNITLLRDQWQHLVMTHKALTGPDNKGNYLGTLKCYVDGVIVDVHPDTKYKPMNSNKLCIGRRADGCFTGMIDEVRVYNGVLKKDKIESLAGLTIKKPDKHNQPDIQWKKINGTSIPIPPNEHPRLYLRSCHIPELKKRLNDPVLKNAWQQLEEWSEETRKKDPNNEGLWGWRYYVQQRGTPVQVEMDAVRYLISKDKELGRDTIEKTLKLMQETSYPTELGDMSRAAGRRMVTGAIVYDWCYELLTSEEKDAFIEEFVRLAETLECGYPPVKQGSVTGHSSEWMILRDLISAAIAIYDEYPEMYNLTASRIFKEHVPVRNWFYPGHAYHQGVSYNRVRYACDLYATWIFDRMGAGNIFHPSQQFIAYTFLYRRRPDGGFLASGDVNPHHNKFISAARPSMLAGSYYKDEYLYNEFLKKPSIDSRGKFFEFLWRDTHLGTISSRDLPLTRYFGFPFGWMIARTGWDDDAVIAEFKVNVYNFLNHQHHDAGAFQIYHKGALAIDSGIYTGDSGNGAQYNSPHNKNYFKRTIAHNSLLIYDPNEQFKSIGYGGADKTKFADNDGGQRLPSDGWHAPKTLEDLLNKDYKTGEILAHGFGPDYEKPEYTYLKGDITEAYSDKVKQVRRSFVFLNFKEQDVPAALIVFDKVISSNKEFKKYWLLHSIEEPEIDGQKITITRTKNGDRGKLVNTTLLPAADNAELKPVGGPGKEFWVFGKNYENNPTRHPDTANERGAWRVELTPKKASEKDHFFNVMQVMDREQKDILEVEHLRSDSLEAAQIGDRVVAFSETTEVIDNPVNLSISNEGTYKILITDLDPGTWQIRRDGEVFIPAIPVRDNGILYFEGKQGQYEFLR
jgi:heparin/heparan-sulfate lyase